MTIDEAAEDREPQAGRAPVSREQAEYIVAGIERRWPEAMRELGICLSRRRHQLSLSQEAVAHTAGITRYHYQQLEKGLSRPGVPANPTMRTITRVCAVLGVDLDDVARWMTGQEL